MLHFYQRRALLPGLAMLALFLYMTGTGLGGTSDSTNYLWAAHTLRAAGHLLAPDGTPYRFWGPLYPMVLAACYSPTAVRVLHGTALLVQLVLYHRIGRWFLPPNRAVMLAWVVALSTAVLVPAKFIWSETVFGALAALYFYALLAWGKDSQMGWLALATATGFLLPLQRTSGFFLLAGVGVGLLLTGLWRGRWRPLLVHWVGCAAGGLAWNYYAEAVAGPPVYQAMRSWAALGSSMADYGYILVRWFVPLAHSWLGLYPILWAIALAGVLLLLWPWGSRAAALGGAEGAAYSFAPLQSLRLLWWVVLVTILALLLATAATRAAAGPYDAERYCAVLVGPVGLLALAGWPVSGASGLPRLGWGLWVGRALLAGWLGYSVVRVGHNAQQLRQRPPIVWPAEVVASGSH